MYLKLSANAIIRGGSLFLLSDMWSIYFCGSIRGGRQDQALYAKIIDTLKTYGTVFTEHVGDPQGVRNGKTKAHKTCENHSWI